jgi:hypothetical protein
MIWRSASTATSLSHAGGLRGANSVALRITSLAVDASHQSALPLWRATQNDLHPLPRRRPSSPGGPPRRDRAESQPSRCQNDCGLSCRSPCPREGIHPSQRAHASRSSRDGSLRTMSSSRRLRRGPAVGVVNNIDCRHANRPWATFRRRRRALRASSAPACSHTLRAPAIASACVRATSKARCGARAVGSARLQCRSYGGALVKG